MKVQWTGMKNSVLSDEELTNDPDVAAAYATEHLIGDLVNRNIYNADDDKLFDAEGNLVASVLPGYTDLDWAKALERNGYRQEYTANFANSGEKFDVFASVGYMNEKGYIINTNFKRYTARLNGSFTPTKWFKGGVNVSASSQEQNYNDNALASKAMGFTFDNSNVSTEYTALTNAYSEYQKQLELGFLNPDEGIPKLVERLKAAGLDDYIAEKQAKLNEWAAANGIQ